MVNVQVAGFFKVSRLRDGKPVQTLEFRNLVTDYGLDTLVAAGFPLQWEYHRVGTGTSAEAAAQTSLDNQVAATAIGGSTVLGLNTSEKYVYFRGTSLFAAGAAAGNLSEIGVSQEATGNNLFSRALIRDVNGDPTTITVLSDEQLQVTYELRLYQPTGDLFSGTVGGRTVTLRASEDTSSAAWGFAYGYNAKNSFGSAPAGGYTFYDGVIGASSGAPSGNNSDVPTGSASFVRTPVSTGVVDISVRAPIGSANFASGVRSVAFSAGPGRFQCQFDPAVPKTSSDRLDLTFRFSVTRRP